MLELRVNIGSQEFVYTSESGIVASNYVLQQSFRNHEVKIGTVNVQVHPKFLGVTRRDLLPPSPLQGRRFNYGVGGGYRAVLKKDGKTVVNGVIPRLSVTRDHPTGVWTVPISQGGSDDLWASLERVRLGQMVTAGNITYHTFDTAVRVDDTDTSSVQYEYRSHRWYDMRSVLEQTLLATAFTSGGLFRQVSVSDLPELTYSIDYMVNEERRTATRPSRPHIASLGLYNEESGYTIGSYTLPDWSGKEMVQAILSFTGWHIYSEYEPYPSRGLRVSVVPDRWPQVSDPIIQSAANSIDHRLLKGGYSERVERAENSESFGVRMGGMDGPVSPVDVRAPVNFTDAAQWMGTPVPAPPPPEAQLAPDTWDFKPGARFEMGSAQSNIAENVVEVALEVAQVVPTVTLPGGQGVAPGYLELSTHGLPALVGAGVFVAHVPPGTSRVLYCHRPQAPASDQPRQVNPVWAASVYRHYDLSRTPQESIRGEFDMSALLDPDDDDSPAVGDPSRGVRFGGKWWMIQEVRRNIIDESCTLTLVRPAALRHEHPAFPVLTGEVSEIRVPPRSVVSVANNVIVVGGVHVITWVPPVTSQGSVLHYEIEGRDILVSTSGIQMGDWQPFGTTRATTFRAFIGPEWPYIGRTYRVRGVGIDGPGPWKEVLAIG